VVFLQELLKQQNLELFETPYVQTIVQFLFSNYKRAIFSKLLPPYILHLIVITAYVHIHETFRGSRHDDDNLEAKVSMWDINLKNGEHFRHILFVLGLVF
jgi:hypothetical protein